MLFYESLIRYVIAMKLIEIFFQNAMQKAKQEPKSEI